MKIVLHGVALDAVVGLEVLGAVELHAAVEQPHRLSSNGWVDEVPHHLWWFTGPVVAVSHGDESTEAPLASLTNTLVRNMLQLAFCLRRAVPFCISKARTLMRMLSPAP